MVRSCIDIVSYLVPEGVGHDDCTPTSVQLPSTNTTSDNLPAMSVVDLYGDPALSISIQTYSLSKRSCTEGAAPD